MKKTLGTKKPISAEAIARMTDRGEDMTRFFTGGRMMKPIQRVNVDFTAPLLAELDETAEELNISRQADDQNTRARRSGLAVGAPVLPPTAFRSSHRKS